MRLTVKKMVLVWLVECYIQCVVVLEIDSSPVKANPASLLAAKPLFGSNSKIRRKHRHQVEKPGCSRFLTARGLLPPLYRGETIVPQLTVQRPSRGNVTGSPFQNIGTYRISI
jgi:hypothetical protein